MQGGIFNQHMDHCQTLMLAVALKAQRMLWVPSLDRDTYSVVFNRQRWHLIEAHEIYDMDSITAMASGTAPHNHIIFFGSKHCSSSCCLSARLWVVLRNSVALLHGTQRLISSGC